MSHRNGHAVPAYVEKFLKMIPGGAEPKGDGWVALCPAHDDHNPSLFISLDKDAGKILVTCRSRKCSAEAIIGAIGAKMSDLREPSCNGHQTGTRWIVATYDYKDENGELLYQVVRYPTKPDGTKDFEVRRPKAGGGWIYNIKGVRVVPYNLPALHANPGRPAAKCEGEKDVDTLTKMGILATCNHGGAEKWTDKHSEFVRGRTIIIPPDNDPAGERDLKKSAISLLKFGCKVFELRLPGLPEKGDVSDWAKGKTKDDFVLLAKNAQPVTVESLSKTEWQDIEPFDKVDLPEFPTHVLPDVLRDWVEAQSVTHQAPADLAGLLALAVCSATISRRVVVQPRPDWTEPVNLYVAVLLDPANRKSSVFREAVAPLAAIEDEEIERERTSVARKQSERRQAVGRLKKLEDAVSKSGDLNKRNAAGDLAEELATWPEADLPRRLVDDATSEQLGVLLQAQGGRIASMSCEGGVFDLMSGLYSRNGACNFQVYLVGHSGDDLIVDRVTRKNLRVERPALTCAYAMQPEVIKGLAQKSTFRGRGLLARFLYAAPRSLIGEREIDPQKAPSEVLDAYAVLIRSLDAKSAAANFRLTFSSAAAALLKNWRGEVERMLGDGGAMEAMKDWGGKLAGETVRLAAVLHCAEFDLDLEIGEGTLAAAISIARYLIPHAEAVFTLMSATDDAADNEAALYILRWIKRHGKSEFSKRDAQQHGRRRFPSADAIDEPLGELTRRGYIRLKPTKSSGPGRPSSPVYEVNPKFNSPEHCTQNSQNDEEPIGRPLGELDSENCEYVHQEDELNEFASLDV